MIAPAIGTPVRPLGAETGSKLEISVVFTSIDGTLAALKGAGNLASSLGGRITLILLDSLGRAAIVKDTPAKALHEFLAAA